MAQLTMRELLEAGVHFGHPTRKWHPNMKKYIYGARNGIHIIDLHKTVEMFEIAQRAVKDIVNSGGHILFVGTKKQARDAIKAVDEKVADEFTARHLGVKKGMPVLLVERTVYSVDGRPVEYTRASYRADRYAYRIRLKRKGSSSSSAARMDSQVPVEL